LKNDKKTDIDTHFFNISTSKPHQTKHNKQTTTTFIIIPSYIVTLPFYILIIISQRHQSIDSVLFR
jgi:hypothetical protein